LFLEGSQDLKLDLDLAIEAGQGRPSGGASERAPIFPSKTSSLVVGISLVLTFFLDAPSAVPVQFRCSSQDAGFLPTA
jgi:hypothetical protein